MKSVTYGIIEEIYEIRGEKRTSYGIAAFVDVDTNGTSNILFSARDLCAEREPLEKLIEKINQTQLSEIHCNDVVDDFLTSK